MCCIKALSFKAESLALTFDLLERLIITAILLHSCYTNKNRIITEFIRNNSCDNNSNNLYWLSNHSKDIQEATIFFFDAYLLDFTMLFFPIQSFNYHTLL